MKANNIIKKYIHWKLIIYSFFVAFFLQACNVEDLLDEQPNNEVMLTDVEHFAELLTPSDKYIFHKIPSRHLIMADYLSWSPETFASVANYQSSFHNEYGYLWADELYSPGAIPDDWTKPYKSIYQLNYILEHIENAPGLPNSNELRLQVKATALAERAYLFFTLVNNYAYHYNPATASKDQGIPMPLINADETVPRSSVAEVYAQIITDCEEALDYLPDLPANFLSNQARYAAQAPSIAGVNGFLSRVYLYMATDKSAQSLEYLQKAKEAAIKSLASYYYLYDLNSEALPTSQESGNREVLWLKTFNTIGIGLTFSGGAEDNIANVDAELLNLYDKPNTVEDPYDLRLLSGLHRYIDYSQGKTFRNNPMSGIHISELVLNKAEAEARLGEGDQAFQTLNELRVKRYYNNGLHELDPSGLSEEEIIEEVINERRREFALCETRWWDTKRLIILREYNRIIKRYDANGTEYSLSPFDIRYVLEFPQYIKDYNPQFTNR